jgi:hypothetical protein
MQITLNKREWDELKGIPDRCLTAGTRLCTTLAKCMKERNGRYTIDPEKASAALTEFSREVERLKT